MFIFQILLSPLLVVFFADWVFLSVSDLNETTFINKIDVNVLLIGLLVQISCCVINNDAFTVSREPGFLQFHTSLSFNCSWRRWWIESLTQQNDTNHWVNNTQQSQKILQQLLYNDNLLSKWNTFNKLKCRGLVWPITLQEIMLEVIFKYEPINILMGWDYLCFWTLADLNVTFFFLPTVVVKSWKPWCPLDTADVFTGWQQVSWV